MILGGLGNFRNDLFPVNPFGINFSPAEGHPIFVLNFLQLHPQIYPMSVDSALA